MTSKQAFLKASTIFVLVVNWRAGLRTYVRARARVYVQSIYLVGGGLIIEGSTISPPQAPQPSAQPLQQSTDALPQLSQPSPQSPQQSTVTLPQPQQPSQPPHEALRQTSSSRRRPKQNWWGKRQLEEVGEEHNSTVGKRQCTEDGKCQAFLYQEPGSLGRRRQDWILFAICKKWLHYECAGIVSPPSGTYDCGCRTGRLERS